jgi:hypothetical protein
MLVTERIATHDLEVRCAMQKKGALPRLAEPKALI